MKPIYINLSELTEPQIKVMEFVDWWVHEKKTTIPFKEIIKKMNTGGTNQKTTIYSIKVLLQKGYIRRSEFNRSNGKASFVKLRGI